MSSPALTMSGMLPTSIVGGTTGWTVKVGKLVDNPAQVVCFYDTGGQNPNPAWLLDTVMVQVITRAGPNSYNDGWNQARKIRDFFLGFESADVGGDRWVSVICQGDTGFIGYDDKERPTFSTNFRIIIEPATDSITKREPL